MNQIHSLTKLLHFKQISDIFPHQFIGESTNLATTSHKYEVIEEVDGSEKYSVTQKVDSDSKKFQINENFEVEEIDISSTNYQSSNHPYQPSVSARPSKWCIP